MHGAGLRWQADEMIITYTRRLFIYKQMFDSTEWRTALLHIFFYVEIKFWVGFTLWIKHIFHNHTRRRRNRRLWSRASASDSASDRASGCTDWSCAVREITHRIRLHKTYTTQHNTQT